MVSQAPPIGAILPGFLAFARGCVLTAHNAPFDIGFLTAACGECRISWPAFPVLDTAALARSVLDETEVPDCKLATLACFFGARTRPCHRAHGRRQGHRRRPAGPARPAGVDRRAHTRGDQRLIPGEPRKRRYAARAIGATCARRAEEAAVVTAIVLVKTDVARIPETAEAIAQIPEVSEVYSG